MTTLLFVLTASGTFLAGVYWKQLASFYKRLKPRKKQTIDPNQRIEALEQMVQAIIQQTNQSLQAIDQSISEIDKRTKKRDSDRTAKVKAIVIEYLKELQK